MIKMLFLLCCVSTFSLPKVDTFFGAATVTDNNFDVLKISGAVTLTNVTATSISASGAFSATQVKSRNSIDVSGAATCKEVATEEASFSGGTTLKHCTFNSLTIHGGSLLEHVTVKTELSISGGIKATLTTVEGKTTVVGESHFRESTLQQANLTGRKHVFYNSSAKTLTVRPGSNSVDTGFRFLNWLINLFRSSEPGTAQVYLKKHSQINGDIIFEDKPGEVYVSGDSQISGTVVNGEIKKKHLF